MTATVTLLVYAGILLIAVLLGGNLTRLMKLTHTRMQLIMSLVSGLMLGVAIFHLLPHSYYAMASSDKIELLSVSLMAGLLAMFLLLRVFHFHHHDLGEDAHEAHCIEDSHHEHSSAESLSWMGIGLGLLIHTIIDGFALAASMLAGLHLAGQSGSGGAPMAIGIGVFIAILMHKPLDALTITTLMQQAGKSTGQRMLVISVFAMICPLTAALVIWGIDLSSLLGSAYLGAALAFSAGVFLCISLSDLLPEIHFHSHDRLKMTVALMLGIGLSWSIHLIESEHLHSANHIPDQALSDTRNWTQSDRAAIGPAT